MGGNPMDVNKIKCMIYDKIIFLMNMKPINPCLHHGS